MKATIERTETFDITIDGLTYTGFKEVDSWECMVKYKNRDGFIITMIPGKLNDSICVNIIACSPCFKPKWEPSQLYNYCPRTEQWTWK